MIRTHVLRIAAFCSATAVLPVTADTNPAQSWLLRQGYAAPTSMVIVACHGYGCSRRTSIRIGSEGLRRAGAALAAGRASPAAERRALGEAIRIYTATLAATFGGRKDVPRSPPGLSGVQGQMDCLDTTANTISLLLVMQEAGLLKHHRVDAPQSRGVFFDGRYPHFTAVIRERDGAARWAVDPWTRATGQVPEILPLSQWQEAS